LYGDKQSSGTFLLHCGEFLLYTFTAAVENIRCCPSKLLAHHVQPVNMEKPTQAAATRCWLLCWLFPLVKFINVHIPDEDRVQWRLLMNAALSIKGVEFLDELSDYYFIKKNPTSLS
jgi:hypothetical protein